MFKDIMPKMLNKKAEKSKWENILNNLGELNGKTIGDIGSGGGFFTLKFSCAVGDSGTVYAIDNDKTKLEFVKKFIELNGQSNVETILCSDHEIPLNQNSVNVFFSRNSFHHISDPEKYFHNLKHFLKDKGRIAIIDYKKTKKINFINLFGHCSSEHNILTAICASEYCNPPSHPFA